MMTQSERFKGILDYFKQHQPDAATELNFNSSPDLLKTNISGGIYFVTVAPQDFSFINGLMVSKEISGLKITGVRNLQNP